MGMDFFTQLWWLLNESDIPQKIHGLQTVWESFQRGECLLYHETATYPWEKPSYAVFCNVVPGSQVPKRRRLDTHEGKIILLHAIAHIEYSAIDLAIDHAYRFRHLPLDYYHDWLLTAIEEARHFSILNELLHELNSYYGALPVHDGLFRAGHRSQSSLALRMAAVPRYMEANGLDAHPLLLQKLKEHSDPFSKKIHQALELIAQEEIEHVKRGNRWFRYACAKEGIDETEYKNLVLQAVPGAKFAKEPNLEARRRAGFGETELHSLFS